MGRHEIKGVITGEPLNVTRTPPKWYRPQHSAETPASEPLQAIGTDVEDHGTAYASTPEGKVIPFRLQRGDYGFGQTY